MMMVNMYEGEWMTVRNAKQCCFGVNVLECLIMAKFLIGSGVNNLKLKAVLYTGVILHHFVKENQYISAMGVPFFVVKGINVCICTSPLKSALQEIQHFIYDNIKKLNSL